MIPFKNVFVIAVCLSVLGCGEQPSSEGIVYFNTAMGYGPDPEGTPIHSHGSWIVHPNGSRFLLRVYHVEAGEKRELYRYDVLDPKRYPEICITPLLLGTTKAAVLLYAPDRRGRIGPNDPPFEPISYAFEFPRPMSLYGTPLAGSESAQGNPKTEWDVVRFYIRQDDTATFGYGTSLEDLVSETKTQNGSVVVVTATPE